MPCPNETSWVDVALICPSGGEAPTHDEIGAPGNDTAILPAPTPRVAAQSMDIHAGGPRSLLLRHLPPEKGLNHSLVRASAGHPWMVSNIALLPSTLHLRQLYGFNDQQVYLCLL